LLFGASRRLKKRDEENKESEGELQGWRRREASEEDKWEGNKKRNLSSFMPSLYSMT
jgi:hypothetical protein